MSGQYVPDPLYPTAEQDGCPEFSMQMRQCNGQTSAAAYTGATCTAGLTKVGYYDECSSGELPICCTAPPPSGGGGNKCSTLDEMACIRRTDCDWQFVRCIDASM